MLVSFSRTTLRYSSPATMSPLVLDPTVINFHQNNVSSMPRLKISQNSPSIIDPSLSSQSPNTLHSNGNLSSHRSPPQPHNRLSSPKDSHDSFDLIEDPSSPIRCSNCNTEDTPLWRRDEEGRTLCNKCGMSLSLSLSLFYIHPSNLARPFPRGHLPYIIIFIMYKKHV